MIYSNGGYYHTYGDDPLNPMSILYKDAGYEGVRGFAIVTTKVTDKILQYWLDKKDKTDVNGTLLYANGPMKAAYGTFLTSLIMIKCHDMIADQAAAEYNVTWSRTTPIIVSVFDDAYRTIMTLECDHRFGMDVTGDAQNITAFRYACSSAINPLEHYVMETLFPGGNGTSIVMGLGKEIINGLMPSMFTSNGYMVMISSDNSLFLILDPETGILRDVMYLNGTVSGEWCFSDLQTEWAFDLGKNILNYGQNIMNILTNGGGIIDFSQLATNTKNGLVGFLSSAMLSLGGSTIFLQNNIPPYLFPAFLGLNIINLCCNNVIINSEEHYVTENIVRYIDSKKQYLVSDAVDAIILAGSITITNLVTRFGIIGIVYTGCELFNDIKDHYMPMGYWQYFPHHKIWETRTYTLCHLDSSGTPIWDEPTMQVEVPFKGDGSLDWDNAVYIHSVTGAKKVDSTQLKELTKGYWWNNPIYGGDPSYGGFTQCPIP